MEVRLIDGASHTWLLSNNQLTAQVSFFLCDPLRYILKRRMQWCGSSTPSGYESVRYALTMPCPSLSVHHINTILYLSFLFSDLVHIDHIFLFYFFADATIHLLYNMFAFWSRMGTNVSQHSRFNHFKFSCHHLLRNLSGILVCSRHTELVLENRCGLLTMRGKIEIYHQCVIVKEQKIIDTSKI